MRKRNLSGMLLSATALLLMAVGIGFVVISKHQVGLSSKPVSTHSKFGLVTVSLLFASVLRSMIRPCLFSDMGNMSDWISRILATALFILSYYTAYLGVRELYLGRVWTDRALILFVVLTVCSLSIEVSTMIAHAVIRVRELCD